MTDTYEIDPTWLVVYWPLGPDAPLAPPMVWGPFPSEDDARRYLGRYPQRRGWAGAVRCAAPPSDAW